MLSFRREKKKSILFLAPKQEETQVYIRNELIFLYKLLIHIYIIKQICYLYYYY